MRQAPDRSIQGRINMPTVITLNILIYIPVLLIIVGHLLGDNAYERYYTVKYHAR